MGEEEFGCGLGEPPFDPVERPPVLRCEFVDDLGECHCREDRSGGRRVNAATAGTVLAAVAVAGLAAMIARHRPRIGRAGGTLALLGLFGPAFFLGVYFAAAQMNSIPARAAAGQALDDTQSTFHVINLAGPCLVVGLILLAVGAYRAGVLGRAQSIGLAVAAIAPVGFISGILPIAVVAWLGLSVALVPLGLRLLTSDN